MSILQHTSAWVTISLVDEPLKDRTVADVRAWLAEVDSLGLPDSTPLEECILTVDLGSKYPCEPILCGDHAPADEVNDLLITLHEHR